LRIEIDLPLFLPNVEEIRKNLLAHAGPETDKVVFTVPGIDAAGLQLVAALRREFPQVEVQLSPAEAGVLKFLLAEVIGSA